MIDLDVSSGVQRPQHVGGDTEQLRAWTIEIDDGIGKQEERVAPVGDVTDDLTHRGDVDGHVLLGPPADDVVDRNAVAVGELDRHHADGRFDVMLTRTDPPEQTERLDHPDHPVPAHSEDEIAVEEDHAGGTSFVGGFCQHGADHRLVAARFVDERSRQASVASGEVGAALAQRRAA